MSTMPAEWNQRNRVLEELECASHSRARSRALSAASPVPVLFRLLLGAVLFAGGALSLGSGVVLLFMIFPFIVAPTILVPLALVPVFAGFVYLRNGVRVVTRGLHR